MRNFSRLSMVCIVATVFGCSGDTTGPQPVLASQAYWTFRLDQHAVNLALTTSTGNPSPYDTLRLHVTAYNANGTQLAAAGPVTYITTDSSVTVDATGLVTAHSVTPKVFVIAKMRMQNVTLTDTVSIQVTTRALSSPLTTFALRPAAGSSTSCHHTSAEIRITGILVQGCGPDSVYATDASGNLLSGDGSPGVLLIAFSSSDSSVAYIDQTGTITTNDTGHVTLYATTWAYGVAKRDSLRYTINNPLYFEISEASNTSETVLSSALVFVPRVIIIAVGGTVTWDNYTFEQPNPIIFDDSVAMRPGCFRYDCTDFPPSGAGNIHALGADSALTDQTNAGGDYGVYAAAAYQARSFPVAGTYTFHSGLYPAVTGVVYVHDVR